MKSIKKSFLIGACMALACTSCNNYLDVQPYGKTIPKTAEEFSALLHYRLNVIDEGSNSYVLGNASTNMDWDVGGGDDFEPCLTEQSGRNLTVYVGSFVSSYSASSIYSHLYENIRDCNIVLDNITETGTELSDKVIGTAYALRAVCYYQLLRMYCEAPVTGQMSTQLGLPLVTEFDMEERTTRSTMQETVDLIESDLNKAEAYNCSDDLYRFTADVVRGYKARLYFWTHQWQKALDEAQKLLVAYPLLDGDNYKAMIKTPLGKTNNHLIKAYRAQSSSSTDNTTVTTMAKYRPVSTRFLKCFQNGEENTDVRYALSVNKKRQTVKSPFCGLRAAELKLIEAESLYHLGRSADALASLNELRRHRIEGVADYTMATLPDANADEKIKVDAEGNAITPLIGAILNERRKELFFEGDRLFELKRNGSPEFWTPYNGRKYVTEQYMYTFPLPESDVRIVDGLVQNPGYTDLKE
jgi:hypothetical protein